MLCICTYMGTEGWSKDFDRSKNVFTPPPHLPDAWSHSCPSKLSLASGSSESEFSDLLLRKASLGISVFSFITLMKIELFSLFSLAASPKM